MAGSLKSYFYFGLVFAQEKDLQVSFIKASPVVWDGKNGTELFNIRIKDTAVVLVLGGINVILDHRDDPP